VIQTNLSTRPFYNERVVNLALTLVAVVALAATLFNVTWIAQLTRRDSGLSTQISRDEAHAADLRAQLFLERVRRTELDLDLFSGALSERELELLLHESDQSFVKFVAADAYRLTRHDAAQ